MKHFITAIFLVFAFQTALSQNYFPDSVRFGVKAGVNFSHINFSKGSPPPEVPIETNWHPGVNFGFLMIVPFAENFFIQPEYMFSQMGGEIEDVDTKYRFNYFSLPVLLRWEIGRKFAVLAGPQFDLLINGKKETGGDSSDATHDIEHRSIGAAVGLEYSFVDNFAIGARYVHGLNHIGLRHEDNLQEFKYEMAQLYVNYKF